jgi:hypothetical protein
MNNLAVRLLKHWFSSPAEGLGYTLPSTEDIIILSDNIKALSFVIAPVNSFNSLQNWQTVICIGVNWKYHNKCLLSTMLTTTQHMNDISNGLVIMISHKLLKIVTVNKFFVTSLVV